MRFESLSIRAFFPSLILASLISIFILTGASLAAPPLLENENTEAVEESLPAVDPEKKEDVSAEDKLQFLQERISGEPAAEDQAVPESPAVEAEVPAEQKMEIIKSRIEPAPEKGEEAVEPVGDGPKATAEKKLEFLGKQAEAEVDEERPMHFLMRRVFGIVKREKSLEELIEEADALKHLRSYTGQGIYEADKEELFEVDHPVSRYAGRREMKGIILAVRKELEARGYSRSGPHIGKRRLGDGLRITNSFFETDIREAVNTLAEQTKIPIMMDDTVQGTVTLTFEKKPFHDVMNMLLLPGGFSYRVFDDHILVGFPQADSPAFNLLSSTKVIHPVYMKPGEISQLLNEAYGKFVKTSDVNNSIVITATPNLMKRISADIAVIDKKPSQIMIKAVIADLTETAKQTLGFDWWESLDVAILTEADEKVTMLGKSTKGFVFSLLEPSGRNTNVTSPTIDPDGIDQSEALIANLHALVETGEARVWATPRVATIDGKKASINISSDEIFSILSGPEDFLQVSTKELKAEIKLEITPRVSENGEIYLAIDKAEVGTISKTGERDAEGDLFPVLTKRSVTTSVVVENRRTIVIGGLLEKQYDEDTKSLPGLSEIPVLNTTAFGTEKKSSRVRDLMIFITPTILEELTPGDEKETFL